MDDTVCTNWLGKISLKTTGHCICIQYLNTWRHESRRQWLHIGTIIGSLKRTESVLKYQIFGEIFHLLSFLKLFFQYQRIKKHSSNDSYFTKLCKTCEIYISKERKVQVIPQTYTSGLLCLLFPQLRSLNWNGALVLVIISKALE